MQKNPEKQLTSDDVLEMYSTSEKIVGKDIDGSDIYEKNYYSDNCTITATTTLDSSIRSNNLKRIIKIDQMYEISNGIWMGTEMESSNGNDYIMYVRVGTSGVQLMVSSRTVSKYRITIRYVKV